MTTVTQKDLDVVKHNFKWVADQLDYLVPPCNSLVIILMGSSSDEEHCKRIAEHAKSLGLKVQIRVSSAHKGTQETLRILAEYEGSCEKVCIHVIRIWISKNEQVQPLEKCYCESSEISIFFFTVVKRLFLQERYVYYTYEYMELVVTIASMLAHLLHVHM